MHKLTFFPLRNADCYRVDLANGRKLLFDFADLRDREDPNDKRIDLAEELRKDLADASREDFDVVAFTHLDDDHIHESSQLFYLEHAEKYQDEDRVKIGELWVPAAAIVETGLTGEAAVIRSEARHRLREGHGIRVFSRPERLKDWLEEQGLTLADREHLITDAGQTIPEFSLYADEVEFFVHSPFAKRQNENEVIDRNTDSLVVQATFVQGDVETKVILASDIDHDVLSDIVEVTRWKNNEARLEWDVFKLPHHCSYTALGPEKGEEETTPEPEIVWLFEEQGQERAILVSTSDQIPAEDTEHPPHRQAAAYYRTVAKSKRGEFKVTMEHPKASAPEPLVIKIESGGASVEKFIPAAAAVITSQRTPRAG